MATQKGKERERERGFLFQKKGKAIFIHLFWKKVNVEYDVYRS